MLARARDTSQVWDVAVVGGGSTGLGIALDAVTRGYSTLLVEKYDFGKGTSSRSTKLIHGGVRYLRQGNIKLVTEALHERYYLLRNASHVARRLTLVVPGYKWWEKPFYGIGLKLYDALASGHGIGGSRFLSSQEALAEIPTLEPHGLRGGVRFYDGQFDDARFLVSLARTAADHGAVLVNYAPVTALLKSPAGSLQGYRFRDEESGTETEIRARVVINATGVFTDEVRHLDDPNSPHLVRPSQGVHLVVDRSFLPTETAIMVPKTDDGRVLFVIPWHRHVLLGTTDTPVPDVTTEPRPLREEIDFILSHAQRYLTTDPTEADVRSVYVGLRPLVNTKGTGATSSLSRDHTIVVERSGMITITGGKWTTYRRMAQDAVDRAAVVANLRRCVSTTERIPLRGSDPSRHANTDFAPYGTDLGEVDALCASLPGGDEPIHPRLSYRSGEVVWAVRHEMARAVEDILARRTRALFLDAVAAREAAPQVAEIMAKELNFGPAWVEKQCASFAAVAQSYLLP